MGRNFVASGSERERNIATLFFPVLRDGSDSRRKRGIGVKAICGNHQENREGVWLATATRTATLRLNRVPLVQRLLQARQGSKGKATGSACRSGLFFSSTSGFTRLPRLSLSCANSLRPSFKSPGYHSTSAHSQHVYQLNSIMTNQVALELSSVECAGPYTPLVPSLSVLYLNRKGKCGYVASPYSHDPSHDALDICKLLSNYLVLHVGIHQVAELTS